MRDGTLVAIAVYSCACGRSLQRVVAGCMLCPSKGLLPKGLLPGRLLMVDCLWPIHLCAIYRVLVGRTDNIPTQARPPSKKWPNMTTRGEWAPAKMSSRAAILEQCTQTARLSALFGTLFGLIWAGVHSASLGSKAFLGQRDSMRSGAGLEDPEI